MRCANCGSTNINIDTQQTSKYSWGKGFLGSLIFGAPGAVVGVGGKTETHTKYHCMACGRIGEYSWVIMNAETECAINNALSDNNVAELQSFKRLYRNIEWTPPVNPMSMYSTPVASTPQNSVPLSNATKPNLPPEKFEIENGVLKKYSGTEAKVTIPQDVASIGKWAFSYCESLTSISLPNSVTSIGNGAFCGCKSLASISISDSVTSIGDSAFWGCESLTSISIPDSVTSIGDYAFWKCSLTSIKISASVTSIGKHAFAFNKFTSITIPDGTKSIGDHAFGHCANLMSITIPKSLHSNIARALILWFFKIHVDGHTS